MRKPLLRAPLQRPRPIFIPPLALVLLLLCRVLQKKTRTILRQGSSLESCRKVCQPGALLPLLFDLSVVWVYELFQRPESGVEDGDFTAPPFISLPLPGAEKPLARINLLGPEASGRPR